MNSVPDPELIEEESYASELFYLLRKCVKRMTEAGLVKHLRSVVVNHDLCISSYDDVAELIVDNVVLDYKPEGVKKEDLYKRSIRGKTTEARKMVIIILKDQLNLKDTHISNFFGRKSRMVAFSAIHEFKNMDPSDKNPQVRDFLARHKRISDKVLIDIGKLKTQQK